VLKDARLNSIVSDADIQEQFDPALQVRNRTSDANQGVITFAPARRRSTTGSRPRTTVKSRSTARR
jgi:hypothetical protein